MPAPATTQLDSIALALKEGAGKLADLLRQQATLRAELESAATDAEMAGFSDFGDVFRQMAVKVGALAAQDGRPTASSARRRGRPPKPADEQPSLT
jgi:DNA-binding protein H-NS